MAKPAVLCPGPMTAKTRFQLSVMMFVEFFIWGVWYVTMGTYLGKLGFKGVEIGDAYSTVNWGAIVAPIFVGMIADRFFQAQKVLGVLHLVGGCMLYVTSTVVAPSPFFWSLLAYSALFMPTLALVNAVAFNQMKDPESEFPRIRVLGTIGWIVATGILVGKILKAGNPDIEATAIPLRIGALASIVLGVFAFTLPATPPKNAGKKVTLRDVFNLDALALMKDRSYAVLVLSSLLISIPLAFYYAFTSLFLNEIKRIDDPAFAMSFGQGSEILFMLLMPFVLKRLGIKKLMLVGMAAWVLRYVMFSMGAQNASVATLYAGIFIHGICYDFFFVSGQIYVDKKAPDALRSSAQGFITLATYGVGMLIGSLVSGRVADAYVLPGGGHDWGSMWHVPAAMAAVVTVIFALAFKDDVKGI